MRAIEVLCNFVSIGVLVQRDITYLELRVKEEMQIQAQHVWSVLIHSCCPPHDWAWAKSRMAGATSLQMNWLPLQTRKGGPLGLKNLGNSCYLNSVLQCLTYTPPLANFCLLNHHSSSCKWAYVMHSNWHCYSLFNVLIACFSHASILGLNGFLKFGTKICFVGYLITDKDSCQDFWSMLPKMHFKTLQWWG